MKIVLDTNVVLDWLIFDDPVLGPLREGIQQGRITVLTHPLAMEELHHVLTRGELGLDAEQAAGALAQYRRQASPAPLAIQQPIASLALPKAFPRCRDPDDDLFLALAFHSRAEALVSRDKALLALKRRCSAFGFAIMSVPELIVAIGQR